MSFWMKYAILEEGWEKKRHQTHLVDADALDYAIERMNTLWEVDVQPSGASLWTKLDMVDVNVVKHCCNL